MSLLILVCIHKSYIVYFITWKYYVVPIGHGFSFFCRGIVMENQCWKRAGTLIKASYYCVRVMSSDMEIHKPARGDSVLNGGKVSIRIGKTVVRTANKVILSHPWCNLESRKVLDRSSWVRIYQHFFFVTYIACMVGSKSCCISTGQGDGEWRSSPPEHLLRNFHWVT